MLEQMLAGQRRLSMIDPIRPYMLCLQDPADAFNDLGRKAYSIKHVQATLNELRNQLREKVALYEDSSTSEVGSLLSPLVGSSFELYEGRRKKLEAYGNAVLGRDADPLRESA